MIKAVGHTKLIRLQSALLIQKSNSKITGYKQTPTRQTPAGI